MRRDARRLAGALAGAFIIIVAIAACAPKVNGPWFSLNTTVQPSCPCPLPTPSLNR